MMKPSRSALARLPDGQEITLSKIYLFWLIYRMRRADSFETMEVHFEVPRSTMWDGIEEISLAMDTVLNLGNPNPPLEDIYDQLPPLSADFPHCKLAVDSTSLQTHRLSPLDTFTRLLEGEPDGDRLELRTVYDMQLAAYDGKHGWDGVKIQTVVCAWGVIRFCSAVVRANVHDSRLFDEAETQTWASVPKAAPAGRLAAGGREVVPIMADAGYINQKRKNLITPYKHYRKRDDDGVKRQAELTPAMKDWNMKIGKARIIVERTNRALKGWLLIFGSGAYPGEAFKIDRFVRLGVWLTNWRVRRHPMVKRLGLPTC
jgi:hypothetical protein